MNCNCKAELEAKLTERYAKQHPDAKNHQVTLGGYGIAVIGNEMVRRGAEPITATADHRVKSSGIYKPKTVRSSMFWSFCPFCGKSVKLESAAEACPIQSALLTDSVIREKARLHVQAGRSWRGLWSSDTERFVHILELWYMKGFKEAQKGGAQ